MPFKRFTGTELAAVVAFTLCCRLYSAKAERQANIPGTLTVASSCVG
jgi:hypothetical protein